MSTPHKLSCPYGCSATFERSHLFCKGQLLPREKAINLDARLIGELDPASLPAGSLPDVVKGAVCERCFKVFKTHVKCQKQDLPAELQIHDGKLGGKKKRTYNSKQSTRADSPHSYERASRAKFFNCPYGCSATFERSHLFCKGQLLPREKAINFDARLVGGFDPASLPAGTLPDVVKGAVCERCFRVFKNHVKCQKQDLPAELQIHDGKLGGKVRRRAYNSRQSVGPVQVHDVELDYEMVLYLQADESGCERAARSSSYTVTQGEQVHAYATLGELVTRLLALKRATVLYQHTDQLAQELLEELQQTGRPGQLNTVKQLSVQGAFTAYNVASYSLSSLADFEASNRLVFRLTGWNLTSKWTLAQLAYEYWLLKAPKQHSLQGDQCNFAKKAYYGARNSCVQGHWRSELADRIEAGEFTYDQLLADPTLDVKFQLDINSLYPAVMRGFEGFETYYPAGEARWLPQVEAEHAFENGQVGMYQVEFERPEGLLVGILPERTGPKTISWLTEPGRGAGVYTEVDLRLAKEHGYALSFTGDALVWDAVGHPFNGYVDELYALRQEKTRLGLSAEATIVKLMLNSLYGKFGQARQGAAEAQIKKVTAEEFYVHVCEKGGEWDSSRTVGDDYYIRLPKVDSLGQRKNYKPNHLGAYVTAWTRKLLVEAMETIDFEYTFCHTDSLRVSAYDYYLLREAGYVDEGALGKFKTDHGVIFEVQQDNVNNYRLKVLTSDGEIKEIRKGKFK